MENKHNKQEAEEKINYIYQVLQNIGNSERKSGFHYVIWGIAIALAMVAHYIFYINSAPRNATYTWIIITGLATVLSVTYSIKERRRIKAESNEKSHTSSVSLIFHTFLFLLLFVIHKTGLQPVPVIFLVYGAWLLATGSIIKFRLLIFGGILNWAMALTAIYVSLPYQLLLGALVCLLSYTLPGYLLNKRTFVNA